MLGYFYLYELSASTRLRSSYFVYFQVKADCLCISLCSGVIRLGVSGYGSSPCVRGQRQGGHCHRVPPGGSFTACCCFEGAPCALKEEPAPAVASPIAGGAWPRTPGSCQHPCARTASATSSAGKMKQCKGGGGEPSSVPPTTQS